MKQHNFLESDRVLSSNYTWNIVYTSGYHYITHTRNGTTYYLQSPATTHNTALRLTTNTSDSGIKWSFNRYTGNVYEDVEIVDLKASLTVGEPYQCEAYMRSTRIGHNGPVSYSTNNSSIAVINSLTGKLDLKAPGTVQVRVTYPGAPWVWIWTITVRTAGCKPYVYMEDYSDIADNVNCLSYAIWNHEESTLFYSLEEEEFLISTHCLHAS